MEIDATSLGLQAAIALFLTREGVAVFRAWQARRWKKDDVSDEQRHSEVVESRKRIEQLYERMLEQQKTSLEQQKLQFEQQRDTLHIIDRNTDALNAIRAAVERELPENTESIRSLIGRIARIEKRLEQ